MIITIDGPAGAGKSTLAKRLAKLLKCSYLDTGAMYRALTLKALRHRINLEKEDELVDLAKKTKIDLQDDCQGGKVFLDSEDVSDAIRSLEVTNNTFYIARSPRVREIMVAWQREIGGRKNIVAEGRDLGTVVFPEASFKFYLDALAEERGRRRYRELTEKGVGVDRDKLFQEILERDQKDLSRTVGPLRQAQDAVYIDSTSLTVDEVVQEMLKYIQKQ